MEYFIMWNEKIIQSKDDGVSEEWSDGEDKVLGFYMDKPDLSSTKAWWKN
jgi:hypothetical protein